MIGIMIAPLQCMSVCAAVLALASSVSAGPVTVLGKKDATIARVPMQQIDHAPWTALLQKHVDERGMVAYARWKSSASDLAALDAYINHLSTATVDGSTPKSAQLAFWINAYNAVTVKGILKEYPTSSIRNHTAKLFGYNIWKDLQLHVAGKEYSLDDMEHQVLRKMDEPRIHFAIVCASIGCPKLLQEAFTAEKLEQQLVKSTRDFFADPTKFSFDQRSGTLSLSPILKWFSSNFGPDTASLQRYIAPYLPEQAQAIARSGAAKVRYLDYDWELNDQSDSHR